MGKGDWTNISFVVTDAVHDPADTKPHHLPHIWNTCEAGQSEPCVMNITTVTN